MRHISDRGGGGAPELGRGTPLVAERRRPAVVERSGERDRGGPDDAAPERRHRRETAMAAAARPQTWRAGAAEWARRRKAR